MIEPWGTPDRTSIDRDVFPKMVTFYGDLLDSYETSSASFRKLPNY
jgi:hypothetical protein